MYIVIITLHISKAAKQGSIFDFVHLCVCLKLFPNYFNISRCMSVGNNFISARGNLPEIISELFHMLIAAREYFPTRPMSLK